MQQGMEKNIVIRHQGVTFGQLTTGGTAALQRLFPKKTRINYEDLAKR